jgi:DegV family protein with EDD domain
MFGWVDSETARGSTVEARIMTSLTGRRWWTMSEYPAWLSRPSLHNQLPARVRIVTDSASDILPTHARAIGVLVVPNWIGLDGRLLRDGVDLTAAQFYAHLPRARRAPHTEPAFPADFYNAYRTAFQQGASAVMSIHVSSRFSQVVRNAAAARDALAPAPVYIIDSLQLGIGMWPAVIDAARVAHQGASVQEVHARVHSLLARTYAFVMVESLEPLRRSGRIGRVQGLVGTLIDAHPILTMDHGEARLVETVRSRRRAVVRLQEIVGDLLRTSGGRFETLLVCGTSIESIAEMETLLIELQAGAVAKTWLGPAIGANLGPAIAVAVVVPG